MDGPQSKATNLWVRGVLEHPSLKKPFKANFLTYACFAFLGGYFLYNIPKMIFLDGCREPERTASDAKKYDRATKSYVG